MKLTIDVPDKSVLNFYFSHVFSKKTFKKISINDIQKNAKVCAVFERAVKQMMFTFSGYDEEDLQEDLLNALPKEWCLVAQVVRGIPYVEPNCTGGALVSLEVAVINKLTF